MLVWSLPLLIFTSGCERGQIGGPVAIVKGTPPTHGMLGVSFRDPPNGLVLSDVLLDGPAFQAGIQPGDQIIAVDREKVESAEDVLSIIRESKPGDQVAVLVRRSDDETTFNVTLCDFAKIIALRSVEDLSVMPKGQVDHEDTEP